jgi:hypothetical protein
VRAPSSAASDRSWLVSSYRCRGSADIRLQRSNSGVPIEEQPFLILGSDIVGPQIDDTVQCEVTATEPNGTTGTALTPATLLEGPV